jgi:hypothetical protein
MDCTEKLEMATFKILSSFIIISGLFFLYILNKFCIWMIFTWLSFYVLLHISIIYQLNIATIDSLINECSNDNLFLSVNMPVAMFFVQ